MRLREILHAKGEAVFFIAPDATLQDVVRTLIEHRVGSLLVLESGTTTAVELLGIITERDILHACAAGSRPLTEVRVSEVMSTALVTGTPDDEVEEVMGLMTTRRIRHLPVIAEGRLVGMISIGDVVKAQHDSLAMENQFMKDYIGRPR
jgi:CBS domain-containing protein